MIVSLQKNPPSFFLHLAGLLVSIPAPSVGCGLPRRAAPPVPRAGARAGRLVAPCARPRRGGGGVSAVGVQRFGRGPLVPWLGRCWLGVPVPASLLVVPRWFSAN